MAGLFSSGVLQQFFSQKTSFSQTEGEMKNYPVLSIVFYGEVNLTNIMFFYGRKMQLKIGKNQWNNGNNTEEVILDSLENSMGLKVFRIIHTTPILERERPGASIRIYTKLEKKNDASSDQVICYLTSRENSPGFFDWTWKDGTPMRIMPEKNTLVDYAIQPQMKKHLEHLGKCQEASYYECVVSQLEEMEFDDCSNKCIPDAFSTMDKNYSTALCQNDRDDHRCILKHKQEITSNCQKSCSILEYFGAIELSKPQQSDRENWNLQEIGYYLTNPDFTLIIHEEYLIYDAIGMIGSVGGTVGMFVLFSNNNFILVFILQ